MKKLATHNSDGSWSLPQVKRVAGLHPTGIGWCDFSANVIRAIDTQTGKIGWHCWKYSPACVNCYAESLNRIRGTGLEYRREYIESGRVKIELDMQRINAILNYRIPNGFVGKAGDGRPKVFWNDMTDGAGEFVTDEMLDTMMAVVALRPDIDHLWLTKRVERLAKYLTRPKAETQWYSRFWELQYVMKDEYIRKLPESPESGDPWPLPNLWVGATVENQRMLDERVESLQACPAAVRFLSVEPLLGALNMHASFYRPSLGPSDSYKRKKIHCIDWAILGCESDGRRAAGFADEYFDAAASVINQCIAADVGVYHKQWPHEGKVSTDLETLPERMRLRQWPKARVA